jgi:hypothetical protein
MNYGNDDGVKLASGSLSCSIPRYALLNEFTYNKRTKSDSSQLITNGAQFMLEILNMHGHVRIFYDYYLEYVDVRKSIKKPLLFQIAKVNSKLYYG